MKKAIEQRLSALEARQRLTDASTVEDARAELLAALERVQGQLIVEPVPPLTGIRLQLAQQLAATYGQEPNKT